MNELTLLLYNVWNALAQGIAGGLVLALGVRILLALTSSIIDAPTRFAVWFATLIGVVALPLLLLMGPPRAGQAMWVLPLRGGDAVAFSSLAACVSVLLLGRLAVSYVRIRRLRRDVVETPPEALERFRAWSRQLPAGRAVQLLISGRAKSPMAVGFRRPAIILPESLLLRLTTEEFDHLGLHELAHIARRDDWMNLTERVLQALFFWHPAVFWICRRLDLERELACDDAVVTLAGGEPKRYARSLARVLELAPWSSGPVLASGAMFRKRQILERIETLMASAKGARPRVSSLTVVVIVMCVFGALCEIARMPSLAGFERVLDTANRRWRWTENGRTLELQTSGEVQFGAEEAKVESISPGGFVRVRESGGTSREVEFRPAASGDGVEARYRVDGREAPLEGTGKQWADATLMRVLRESGVNAEERIAGILAKRGAAGVLDEVDRIGSEDVRRKYLEALFDSQVSPEDQVRAFGKAARLRSDHDKAELLLHLRDRAESAPLHAAWLEAAGSIRSDDEKARVLGAAAPVEAAGDGALLRSVRTIGSDHDKANVLIRLAAGPYTPEFLNAVRSIGSDDDKQRVIRAMLGRDAGLEAAQAAVTLTRSVASDHEKSSLLQRVLELHGDKPEIRTEVRKAAERIGSDSEYRRVVSKIQFEVQCKDGPSCG